MTQENKLEQPTSTEPTTPDVLAEFNRLFKTLLNRKTREDIKAVYTNFATFEIGDLDLTILFGQINQQPGRAVDLHTAVTMAWAEAKILSFFLRVNLAIYEMQHAPIAIPDSMLPAPIPAPDEKTSPTARKTFDTLKAIHDELIEEQKSLRKKGHEESA